jgi:hypothetical protein
MLVRRLGAARRSFGSLTQAGNRFLQFLTHCFEFSCGRLDVLGQMALTGLLHPGCPRPELGGVLGVVSQPVRQKHAKLVHVIHVFVLTLGEQL